MTGRGCDAGLQGRHRDPWAACAAAAVTDPWESRTHGPLGACEGCSHGPLGAAVTACECIHKQSRTAVTAAVTDRSHGCSHGPLGADPPPLTPPLPLPVLRSMCRSERAASESITQRASLSITYSLHTAAALTRTARFIGQRDLLHVNSALRNPKSEALTRAARALPRGASSGRVRERISQRRGHPDSDRTGWR